MRLMYSCNDKSGCGTKTHKAGLCQHHYLRHKAALEYLSFKFNGDEFKCLCGQPISDNDDHEDCLAVFEDEIIKYQSKGLKPALKMLRQKGKGQAWNERMSLRGSKFVIYAQIFNAIVQSHLAWVMDTYDWIWLLKIATCLCSVSVAIFTIKEIGPENAQKMLAWVPTLKRADKPCIPAKGAAETKPFELPSVEQP